jgi:hypothetical protein
MDQEETLEGNDSIVLDMEQVAGGLLAQTDILVFVYPYEFGLNQRISQYPTICKIP